MKIVIADDERLARVTLRAMLEDYDVQPDRIFEVETGPALIDAVALYTPEIAFVDIRMPQLDGLEAIRRCRAFSPHTRWIIVSGYSEFAYAQEAVRLGVADYVVKPVEPRHLEGVIQAARQSMSERIADLNRRFESDLVALLHGLIGNDPSDFDSFMQSARYCGAILCCDSHLPEREKAGRQADVVRHIRATALAHSGGGIRIGVVALPSGNIAVVGGWEHARDQIPLARLLRTLGQFIADSTDDDFALTLVQMSAATGLSGLAQQVQALSAALPLRAACGVGKVWSMAELASGRIGPSMSELSQLAQDLLQHDRDKALLAYIRSAEAFARVISQITATDPLRATLAHFLHCAFGCSIRPESEVRQWVQSLQRQREQRVQQPQQTSTGISMIAQVIDYMDHNYMLDISISQIAETMHVTPNYLSTIFHKKTGMTFVRYLTQVRIHKARELLTDPTLTIQQVAERVGYYSPRYFSVVFKEWAGCYPSEYRKKGHVDNQTSRAWVVRDHFRADAKLVGSE